MASNRSIVLITGANRGIGYEVAKNLLFHSTAYHVLLSARSLTDAISASTSLSESPDIKGIVTPLELDITSTQSVEVAAQSVKDTYGHLDMLINNAGIVSKLPDPTENMRAVLEVNVVGTISVTEAFLPLLHKSLSSTPRIIFVSSSVGSLTHAADPASKYYNPAGMQYRASKAALNMVMVQYTARMKAEGGKTEQGREILVHGADPGLCATDLVDREWQVKRGAVPAEIGGKRVAVVVRGEKDESVGKVVGEYGVSPW